MDGILQTLFGKYEMFLLILVRTSGIFFISPFFSSQNIPNTMKVGFSFIVSILLAVTLDIDLNLLELSFVELIFKELMVGTIIGFISYVFLLPFMLWGK